MPTLPADSFQARRSGLVTLSGRIVGVVFGAVMLGWVIAVLLW